MNIHTIPFATVRFWLFELRYFFLATAIVVADFFLTHHWGYLAVLIAGAITLTIEAWRKLREGEWTMDYIAFLALAVAVYTGQYLAGALVSLMLIAGRTIEALGTHQAEKNLKNLRDTLPKTLRVVRGQEIDIQDIHTVKPGATIEVRENEMIPLDGVLVSNLAILSTATLTGEADPVRVLRGETVRSGTTSQRGVIQVHVTQGFESSTYQSFLSLASSARSERPHFVHFSERATIVFTVAALALAALGYVVGGMDRMLAVLVVATPCPLLIAAPLAYLAGQGRAAGMRMIVRSPRIFELLPLIRTVCLDKTGTLTDGKPTLTHFALLDESTTERSVWQIVGSLESASIHPLAQALVTYARTFSTALPQALGVRYTDTEISGTIDQVKYTLKRAHGVADETHGRGWSYELLAEESVLAEFSFADRVKSGVHSEIAELQNSNKEVVILTGDRQEVAEALLGSLGATIQGGLEPTDKMGIVREYQKNKKPVLMLGDGVNDVGALKEATVGVMYSRQTDSAALEAADIALFRSDIGALHEVFALSNRVNRVARQSVYMGVGLSIVAMGFAYAGYLPAVQGAIVQECIDILAVGSALRVLFDRG